MKNQYSRIISICLFSIPLFANAQFNTPLPFDYGRTDGGQQKIGIGNFAANGDVQAKLHVNEFLLAGDAATAGRLFRTDGSNTRDNNWSIYTGGGTTTVTEKLRISVPSGSNAAEFRTVQNGHMNVFTNSIQRMTIQNNGNVGIGTDRPQQLFEVAGGDINLANDTSFYRIANKPALAQDALILKAADADSYFKITVNDKGEISTTPISEGQLAEL